MPEDKNLKRGCSLCFLQKKTSWLEKFFGPYWKIIICDHCGVPQVVYKFHSISPPQDHKEKMIQALQRAAEEFFGSDDFYIDETQRKIKNHWHIHARKGKGK